MIISIFLNLLVILSTYLLTKRFFSEKSFVDFILSWFTLFLAQILVVELYLGIMGQLYFFNVILLHLGIFLVVYSSYRKRKYPPFSSPDIDFIFNNKILLFAVSIFLGFFLVKLWINLINPPIGADSLMYHLTFPVTWLKNGNLQNPMIIFGRGLTQGLTQASTNSIPYYPINGELFFFWLMLPLKNAFFSNVGQIPFYFIGIIAIYSILRKFNINKHIALFMPLLWVLIPNCLKHIEQGAYIDIICAALFFMTLNFLLILDREFNLRNAFIFAVCLGIFIGTKALNIFWSLALMPFFIYTIARHNKKQFKISTFISFISLIFLGLIIFGGYSYIRNYILTKNIFYPIKFSIFGKTIMPGYVDRLTYADLTYPMKDFSLKKLFFSEGLGAQFLLFIFPATFIPLLYLCLINKHKDRFWEYLFIFIIPTLIFSMFLFYIKAYWTRYLYAYLGMGLITAAIFLDNFKWGKRYITIFGFIAILSSTAELAGHFELAISILLSFAIFMFFVFKHKYQIAIDVGSRRIIAISLILVSIGVLFFLNNKYNKEEFGRYTKVYKEKEIGYAWKWLNDYTGSGMRIAYTGRAEFYPLFGKGFKNDVFYISINDKPSIPHYYPDGLYRKEKNEIVWLNNLKEKRIGVLVIYQPHDDNQFPVENEWAIKNPDKFKLVFENSKAIIYSVLIN